MISLQELKFYLEKNKNLNEFSIILFNIAISFVIFLHYRSNCDAISKNNGVIKFYCKTHVGEHTLYSYILSVTIFPKENHLVMNYFYLT